MIGRHHFESGAITGGLLSTALQLPILDIPLFMGTVMFFALVPDIDCPGSTVTESLPLIGKPICWFVRRLSHVVYMATKGPRDENWEGTHRHLSHTIVFALFMGLLVWLPIMTLLHSSYYAWLLGGAAALGCWTHCLGDSLTIMGCPWLWPIPIAGETWYEIRTPSLIRFHTGSPAENTFAWLVIYPAALLAFPGAYPIVHDLVTQLVGQLSHGGTVLATAA